MNNTFDEKKQNKYIAVFFIILILGVMVFIFIETETTPVPVQDPTVAVISTSGTDMSAPLSDFFGRSPYFIIYDMKNDSFKSVKNPYLKEAHAAGLRTGTMLVGYKVGTVLCKNIGIEPMSKFKSLKMRVYIGAAGTAADAIIQFKSGQLIETTKPNVPTHFGLTGQAPCPNIPGQPQTRVANPMLPSPLTGAKAKQIAFPVQNPQGNGWTLVCPKCNNLIIINNRDISLSRKIICPNCGNKGTLGFINQTRGQIR